MNKTQVVNLRIPVELKIRLENEAKYQGVSLNNLANYFLVTQLSQFEALSVIDARLSKKNIAQLKSKVNKMLDAIPKQDVVPEWDAVLPSASNDVNR